MQLDPIRLSSRLSLAYRLLYAAIYLVALGLAVSVLVPASRPTGDRLVMTVASIAVALAFGPLYLAIFSFRETTLEGDDLVVRGIRRTWRFPVQQTRSIVTTQMRDLTIVRIELVPPVDGLGSVLRVMGPILEPRDYVADVIRDARGSARSGA